MLAGFAGLAAAGTAADPAAGQTDSGGETPDFGDWLLDVDGGYRDARGEETVTVQVGAQGNNGPYAFRPAGLWVDPGTTIRWRWTGEGGAHNVHAQRGADFESDLTEEAGFLFEHTIETTGITTYQCDPHADLGMKGALAVGDDVPTVSAQGGLALPGGAVGVAFMALMLGTVGLAAVAVLGGEVYGSIASRTDDGNSSAYATAIAVGLLGAFALLLIAIRLVTA